jgi:hypothetical protein
MWKDAVVAMAEHKFKIGEIVFFTKVSVNAPQGAYEIIKRLPTSDGAFQYVIRSAREDHRRVAKEYELSRDCRVETLASRASFLVTITFLTCGRTSGL